MKIKAAKRQKPYWEMNTEELAEATKEFDDPNYHPPAVKPTAAGRAQLQRWRKRRAAECEQLTLVLEKKLIAETDRYAITRGRTVSDVVSDALRQLMRKKSA